MNCCTGVWVPNNGQECPGSLWMTCICINVTNFVQYIMAHDKILTKCSKLNFEKLMGQNFFKLLVSIRY